MLFYPTRRSGGPLSNNNRHGSPRPISTGEAGDAMHLTWMLKSFVMGITLLGLSYWLVQIAGVQYLASLTSATLLGFLLVYVVWYVIHRNRQPRQTLASGVRIEVGSSSVVAGSTSPIPSTPPPPFDRHQAYKFCTAVPPRDCSPPPTYEEALRAMVAMTATSPCSTYPISSSDLQPASPVSATIPPTLPPGLALRPSYATACPVQNISPMPLHSTSPTTISSTLTSVPFLTLTRTPSALTLTPASALMTSPPAALISTPSSSLTIELVPTSTVTTTSSLILPPSSTSSSSASQQSPQSTVINPYFSLPSFRPDTSPSQSSVLVSSTPRQISSTTTVDSAVTQSSLTSTSFSTQVQPSDLTTPTSSGSLPESVKLPTNSPLQQNQSSTSNKTISPSVIQSSTIASPVVLTSVVSHAEKQTWPSASPSPPPSPPLQAPIFTHFDMGEI